MLRRWLFSERDGLGGVPILAQYATRTSRQAAWKYITARSVRGRRAPLVDSLSSSWQPLLVLAASPALICTRIARRSGGERKAKSISAAHLYSTITRKYSISPFADEAHKRSSVKPLLATSRYGQGCALPPRRSHSWLRHITEPRTYRALQLSMNCSLLADHDCFSLSAKYKRFPRQGKCRDSHSRRNC
ncbi:hypothetical protein K469DRAFT_266548 [Zopfia rhizophila CBS 207.26]|uniref:Uncharacterized protein n=1 Tax=Zopfia rhizophila CBS 207.26 TaxID=1314779 RepID=A0A6A6DN42_9PEZI|nr:hypothetical protein K469DRAFT_266548 [Zopfia rhizophila CBS 207.26]